MDWVDISSIYQVWWFLFWLQKLGPDQGCVRYEVKCFLGNKWISYLFFCVMHASEKYYRKSICIYIQLRVETNTMRVGGGCWRGWELCGKGWTEVHWKVGRILSHGTCFSYFSLERSFSLFKEFMFLKEMFSKNSNQPNIKIWKHFSLYWTHP